MKKLSLFGIIFSLMFFVMPVPAVHAAVGSACTLESDCSSDAPHCNFTTFTCQVAATSGSAVAPNPGTTGSGSTVGISAKFVPLAPIPGLTADSSGNPLTSTPSIPTFLNNIYKYLIGLAAALAVIMIVWGGLEIATQDVPGAHADGREKIKGAIFGLVLILSPVLIFSIINPSILNLSLNIPALQTPAGKGTGGNMGFSGGSGSNLGDAQPTTTPTTGKPQVVHGNVVDKQFSVTPAEAESFVSACANGGGVGYYAGGVLGNLIYDGQSCTAQKTTQSVSGSNVSSQTKCNAYQYTAFCSKKITLSVVVASLAYLNPISHLFNVASHGFPLDATSGDYWTGCKTDGGTLTLAGTERQMTCPANTVDLIQSHGMKSGICYSVTASCHI